MALHRSGYSRKKAELEIARREHALEVESINVELAHLRRRAVRAENENSALRIENAKMRREWLRDIEANQQLLDDLQGLVTKRSPWIPRLSVKQLLFVFANTDHRIRW
jgi:hypothetical protein